MKLLPLTKLEAHQTGIIKEIQGGRGRVARLNALGLIPGKKITKVSAMMMRGPVVVRLDNTEIALGFGMANSIIVEVK
jgi:ferrous iron transport protein A|uniref:Ferrous iron transport protein A n=1 Tax=candidate division WOR-3 bacterium TaxID=2052148 RepID=A0A7C6EBE3_UNCW3